MPLKSVFISYSSKDSEFAIQVVRFLMSARITVWFDKNRMKGGTFWDESLATAIEKSDVVLLILTEDSVQSNNVKKEISWAEKHNKTIIPLRLKECELPFHINPLDYIDFSIDKSAGQQKLIRTLDLTPKQKSKLIKSKVFKPKKRRRRRIVTMLLLVALMVALWVFRDKWVQYLYDEPSEVTVMLQPANSDNGWITPNQGTIQLTQNFLLKKDTIWSEEIESNGATVITLNSSLIFSKKRLSKLDLNVPGPYKYRLANPDTNYVISKKNDTIRLKVGLEAYKVNGMLKAEAGKFPIQDAKITYLNIESFINEPGSFELIIPEDLQQDSILTVVEMDKFLIWSEYLRLPKDSLVEINLKLVDSTVSLPIVPREINAGN